MLKLSLEYMCYFLYTAIHFLNRSLNLLVDESNSRVYQEIAALFSDILVISKEISQPMSLLQVLEVYQAF
jgi:hypothetical protein